VKVTKKSSEAFRTISEVSSELDVPQHVLRFWESRFSHIRPMKRAGGRRYYRPADIRLLAGIQGFLYVDGYTIKGVQKLLRERGAQVLVGRSEGRSLADMDKERDLVDLDPSGKETLVKLDSVLDSGRVKEVVKELDELRGLLEKAL
jgi:DNA-binding transcriptional MerR regulator